MNKMYVALIVLAITVGLGNSVANAAPYASGNLGFVMLKSSDIDVPGIDKLSYEGGFGIFGSVGNEFDNGLRTEVELSYQENSTDDLDVDGENIDVDGDIAETTLMLNVFYDFNDFDMYLKPFVGAGVGYSNIELDLDDIGSEDDDVFSYQLSVGTAIALSPRKRVDIQFRYVGTDDPKLGGSDVEYTAINLMVGFRHSF